MSSPEATALDLVGYKRHCGGINNVATVLSELAEQIDPEELIRVAGYSHIAWTQRLGYLLDLVEAKDLADRIAEYIKQKRPNRKPLAPWAPIKGATSNNRWKLLINNNVEVDET